MEMGVPADPPTLVEPGLLVAATGALPVRAAAWGVSDALVEVASAAACDGSSPTSRGQTRHGLIVTATGGRPGVDFVSRCFYPAAGVAEDSVTGSAHTTLANWWAPRLGRNALVGERRRRAAGSCGSRCAETR